MVIEALKQLVAQGESDRLEFKKSLGGTQGGDADPLRHAQRVRGHGPVRRNG